MFSRKMDNTDLIAILHCTSEPPRNYVIVSLIDYAINYIQYSRYSSISLNTHTDYYVGH